MRLIALPKYSSDRTQGFAQRERFRSGSIPCQHATRESSRRLALSPFLVQVLVLILRLQAYTVLQSTTDSVFLHVTTHAKAGSEWGSLFKSNSNGTYYSLSLEYANRDSKGFADFEKMVGLEGIALMNVVSNPEEAALSGYKKLQTRITHNDGPLFSSSLILSAARAHLFRVQLITL